MPRHVPRRCLHAARAAGLFFVRPHREANPTPTPPAKSASPDPTAPVSPSAAPTVPGLGSVTTWVYDADRPLPSGPVSWVEYDLSRRPTALTDSLGCVTTSTYDAEGRLLSRDGPDPAVGDAGLGPLPRATTCVYDLSPRRPDPGPGTSP
jgi:YD repeat-containing protein